MSDNPTATQHMIQAAHSNLLSWYETEGRDLPWRRTTDPYAVLVSEFMLQQTRVETVIRYYPAFLQRFPDMASLAAATRDAVLKAWEGLGYYRRAHGLHATAIQLVRHEQGTLPSTVDGLQRLPGIGPYTAAAVASIAFGRDVPVLDGNTMRVLARLFSIAGPTGRPETRRKLESAAVSLLPPGRAGDFNQALMDLGSLICSPGKPDCGLCPISTVCSAHAAGAEAAYPTRTPRKATPHRDIVAGIIWSGRPYKPDSRILISKRHSTDMLGGMWEFPGGHVEPGESLTEALARELTEELAIGVTGISPFMNVDHAYTHFRMTLHVFHCIHASGKPQALASSEWTWASIGELARFAFPAADKKIIERLVAGGGAS